MASFLILFLLLLVLFTLFVSNFYSVNAASDRSTIFLTLTELSAKACANIGLNSVGAVAVVALGTRTEVVVAIELNLTPVRVSTESSLRTCGVIDATLIVLALLIRDVHGTWTAPACAGMATAASLYVESVALLVVIGGVAVTTAVMGASTTCVTV